MLQVDVTYMNGEPAEDIALDFNAETDKKAVVLERRAGGRVSEDKTNELGQGRFVVDVPRTFDIEYLDITVRNVHGKRLTGHLVCNKTKIINCEIF